MDKWACELVYQHQNLTQNTAPDLTLKTYMPCLLKTGGIKSKTKYLKKGVPQGGVLSPTFLMTVQNIRNSVYLT